MKNVAAVVTSKYSAVCRSLYVFGRQHSTVAMFGLGALELAAGLAHSSFAIRTDPTSFDDSQIVDASEAILTGLVEGSFGALVMIVSGLIAIVAAALGAYRAALAALMVAVGAFILRAVVNLFFGDVLEGGGN